MAVAVAINLILRYCYASNHVLNLIAIEIMVQIVIAIQIAIPVYSI